MLVYSILIYGLYSNISFAYTRAMLYMYILLICISRIHILYLYTRIQVDQLRDRSQALVTYATLAYNKLNKADTLKALTLMQAQLK